MKKLITFALIFLLTACANHVNNTPEQQRAEIKKMAKDVLTRVVKENPRIKEEIRKSAGYAVFSNAQVNLFFISAGGGYGLVHENKTNKNTYMNMGEAGLGVGLGVKDFRVVFVFHNTKTLNTFINEGWAFGAEADAAAKTSDKGDAASAGITLGDISVYQLTESGLALQAMVKGTKYWKNNSLN
jgi:lipid-binding SYLF domain-containing protein